MDTFYTFYIFVYKFESPFSCIVKSLSKSSYMLLIFYMNEFNIVCIFCIFVCNCFICLLLLLLSVTFDLLYCVFQ